MVISIIVGFFSIVGVLIAIQKEKKGAVIPIVVSALIILIIFFCFGNGDKGGITNPTPSNTIAQHDTATPAPIIQTLTDAFPEKNAKLHEFSKSNSSETISTYAGPGKNYAFIEKIKPAAKYTATVCFIENNWALTHLVLNKYDRYIYVDATRKNNGLTNLDDIGISYPYVSSLNSVTGIIKEKTSPKWGPGDRYETTTSPISHGTPVKVIFQENGYYYIECDQNNTIARVWVPIDNVSFDTP